MIRANEAVNSDLIWTAAGCNNLVLRAIGAKTTFSNVGVAASIDEPLISDAEDVDKLDISGIERDPGIAAMLESTRILKERVGDQFLIGISQWGPMTLAGLLMGTEDFMVLTLRDKAAAEHIMDFTEKLTTKYWELFVEAGAELVSQAEPSASGDMISHKQFERMALPHIQATNRKIDGKVKAKMLHICGNINRILPYLPQTGSDVICIEAISRGMSIISLADPSGMLELLGEKRYKEFCAFYAFLLIRTLDPYLDNAVVHICPRTSLILERLRLVQGEMRRYENENYASAVLELSRQRDVRVLGHRCINAKYSRDNRAYVLNLNPPEVCIRPMKERDWGSVSGIYGEGIRSGKATIVKSLPDREGWLAAHGTCLVAEYLGNVVGFAALSRKSLPELSVYIDRNFRCQGVGTALLRELQRQAGGKIRSLIFADNTPSIRLHEKLGFVRTGEFCFTNDPRQVLVYEWEARDEQFV